MMRDATKDKALLFDEDGVFYGLALGWDHVGEHHGFGSMLDTLLPKAARGPRGIEKRRFNINPERVTPFLLLKEYPRPGKTVFAETRLALARDVRDHREDFLKRRTYDFRLPTAPDRRHPEKTPFTITWGRDGFAIRAFSVEARAAVRDLHAAILADDLALVSDQSRLLEAHGPVLVIPSRLPAAMNQKMIESDIEDERLDAADLATGIREKLKEAGLGYHALSPEWTDFFKKPSYVERTTHKVIYFLNPARQQDFNHGWFTVEELEAWIRGEGPIVKSA